MDFSHSSNIVSTQTLYPHNTMVHNYSPLFPPSFPSPISIPLDPIYQTLPPLNPNICHVEFAYPLDSSGELSSQSFELQNLPHLSPFQTNGLTFEQCNSLFNLDPPSGVIFNNEGPINTTSVLINEGSQNAVGEGRMKTRKSQQGRRNGKWDEEEDRQLKELVEYTRGRQKWSEISKKMENRSGKQCRERWLNQIRPNIKKDKVWSEEEEEVIIRMHKRGGNRWSIIAKNLPGRTECSVKNHWNATKRKLQMSNELKPPLSLLSQYILGLLLSNA